MRFVVVGAGAIGGVVGGRLARAGYDVGLVARGEHGRVLAGGGLTLKDPDGAEVLHLPVTLDPGRLEVRDGDVVLCAVKSQHTFAALEAVYGAGGPEVPIVCLQNGVQNERTALRLFRHVYGVVVMCPAVHLTPGVVCAHSTPVTGLLDIGRYPAGRDSLAGEVAAAFEASTFRAEARPDIMRPKYGKLLMNLGNAVEVVCGPEARNSTLSDAVRTEAEAVLDTAGIDADTDVDPRRRDMQIRPVADERWQGSSTWQSITRGAGTVETDYLNGEIALLGRLHDTPAPLNELVQRLAWEVATGRRDPGAATPDEVLARAGVEAPA